MQLCCNPKVQYNRLVLIEKSVFLETFKQILNQYTPEIEFHQNSQCENILATFFQILEKQINGAYRLSKRVFEFSDNSLIKQTKRLLLGPENESSSYSELPSVLMVNSQTLSVRIFQFMCSLSESGLTELQHYISVMDIKRYHQTNLSEIKEELSKLIIKTQTLLDNPVPQQKNTLDLKA